MSADTSVLGHFVWHDLITTDVSGSVDFYQRLFPEWSIDRLETGEGSLYHVIEVNGRDIGGLVGVPEDSGIPAHWIGYVAVDDCDAAVRRTIELGGKCLVPAIDVPQIGRFAIIQDPQGAVVKPFSAQKRFEIPRQYVPGRPVWNELLTSSPGSIRDFYRSVFGWSSVEQVVDEAGAYTLFRTGESDVAGAMHMPADAEIPTSWLTYFHTGELDARAHSVQQAGGQTIVEPRPITGSGHFSVHVDPAGAFFALMNRQSSGE